MRKFKIFGDIIALNTEDKTIQINNNTPITFKRMDEIIQETKNVNRINKPIALLLYTDYKNGKINNYKEMEVK